MSSYLYYFLRNKGLIIARSGGSLPNSALTEAEVAAIQHEYEEYAFEQSVLDSERKANIS